MAVLGGWVFLMSEVPLYATPQVHLREGESSFLQTKEGESSFLETREGENGLLEKMWPHHTADYSRIS